MEYDQRQLAYVYGQPAARARLRATPDDFQVDEIGVVEPDGEGEHLLLLVRKRNQNSATVARELARVAGVPERDIGYAGLKDRVAVTTQWFSIHLPGRDDPDWSGIALDGVELLQAARHGRKLKRGALRGNRFILRLHELQGDRDDLLGRLERVAAEGVPNYFGAQRFGYQHGNLAKAAEMFTRRRKVKNRQLRGLYLSAARSMIFNRVVSDRVAAGNWNRLLPGEAVMLDGSRNFFLAETIDAELEARLARFDIHPSAPLWGRGRLPSSGEARVLEEQVVTPLQSWCDGLEHAGLKQERRATRLLAQGLEWSFPDETTLELRFALPAGCYATTLLRELVTVDEEEG